jgi:predicted glutamine amidotransferase
MCRFIAYKGKPLLLADLVIHPSHSLVHQSYNSKERPKPTNGDGFGLGWYAPKISEEPCFFTSVTPAWANQNLRRIAAKTVSPCIFAHVRAASAGLGITQLNCHPFQFGRYLWMHNGIVGAFRQIKRNLRRELNDDSYHAILGTTDSENAFGLFLNFLPDLEQRLPAKVLAETMAKTIARLSELSRAADPEAESILNFAVTDGEAIVASRYSTNSDPATLYYCTGADYECPAGTCHIDDGDSAFTIIASEPLTELREQWSAVPPNHLVVVQPERAPVTQTLE